MIEHNRSVIQSIFREIFNGERYELMDDFYCEDMRNYDVSIPNQPNSKEEIVSILKFHRVAFPDLEYTLKQIVCEGEMVAFRWSVAGTHLGPLGDIPATGNAFDVEGMSFVQFRDGKVHLIWQMHDTEATHAQLGLPPVTVSANAASVQTKSES
ncbi:MAG: ester cyclase [Planctomycetota bacterium]